MSASQLQPDWPSPARILQRLVEKNALGDAEQLLRNLDTEALGDCIEEMRSLMRNEGFELPDWERLSDDELRKLAAGQFYVEDGRVVLAVDE